MATLADILSQGVLPLGFDPSNPPTPPPRPRAPSLPSPMQGIPNVTNPMRQGIPNATNPMRQGIPDTMGRVMPGIGIPPATLPNLMGPSPRPPGYEEWETPPSTRPPADEPWPGTGDSQIEDIRRLFANRITGNAPTSAPSGGMSAEQLRRLMRAPGFGGFTGGTNI